MQVTQACRFKNICLMQILLDILFACYRTGRLSPASRAQRLLLSKRRAEKFIKPFSCFSTAISSFPVSGISDLSHRWYFRAS